MSDPSPKLRFTLTYTWHDDPHFAARFDALESCKLHVRDVVQRPVRIYDSWTHERGTLYPSGTLRWNPRQ